MSSSGVRRPGLLVGLAVLGVLAAAAVWTGWQIWRVNVELRAAVSDASDLQSAVEAGDDAAARTALEDLTEHTDSAADRTRGTTWSALARSPWFGDDAAAVRLVADVVNELARDGLAPLVDDATALDQILPRDGQIPLDTLVGLQQPVDQASRAFAKADQRLDAENPSRFTGQLEVRFRDLHRRVSEGARVLATADVALELMPGMLGRDDPRTYLLVFQNNAEARSTGGLPGALSVMHADNGRLRLGQQATAGEFPMLEEPILPLSDAEREIYGDQLGTYFQDANFTPDFPRAAELMGARWESQYPDALDGIFAIDPVALSYILEATGPVSVGDVELSAENVVDELLHRTYLRLEGSAEQDGFFRRVAQAVFERVTTGADDPRALFEALRRADEENRLYLHSFDPTEQSRLTGRSVAGELAMDPGPNPQVGVYLNDATGSKMSYFLRTTVRVDAVGCREGRQSLTATARLRSEAPPDAASLPDAITGGGDFGIAPGTQLVAVRFYAPVGGSLDRIVLNGRALDEAPIVRHETREVASVYVALKPQQTLDLSWQMETGPAQTGDVVVSVTPGIDARTSSSVAASSC